MKKKNLTAAVCFCQNGKKKTLETEAFLSRLVSRHLVVGENEAGEAGQLCAKVKRDPRHVVVAEQEGRQALVSREVVELLDLVVGEVHRVELVLGDLLPRAAPRPQTKEKHTQRQRRRQ